MVPPQVLQHNSYFCAIAGQIHTHSSDEDTWSVWGFIIHEPECSNNTKMNHLYPQNNEIHSPTVLYAKFPRTIYSVLMQQIKLCHMNTHALEKF
jgi:hypothetical protein